MRISEKYTQEVGHKEREKLHSMNIEIRFFNFDFVFEIIQSEADSSDAKQYGSGKDAVCTVSGIEEVNCLLTDSLVGDKSVWRISTHFLTTS